MISGGRLLGITPIMMVAYFCMLDMWKKSVSLIAVRQQLTNMTTTSEQKTEEKTLPHLSNGTSNVSPSITAEDKPIDHFDIISIP